MLIHPAGHPPKGGGAFLSLRQAPGCVAKPSPRLDEVKYLRRWSEVAAPVEFTETRNEADREREVCVA